MSKTPYPFKENPMVSTQKILNVSFLVMIFKRALVHEFEGVRKLKINILLEQLEQICPEFAFDFYWLFWFFLIYYEIFINPLRIHSGFTHLIKIQGWFIYSWKYIIRWLLVVIEEISQNPLLHGVLV